MNISRTTTLLDNNNKEDISTEDGMIVEYSEAIKSASLHDRVADGLRDETLADADIYKDITDTIERHHAI